MDVTPSLTLPCISQGGRARAFILKHVIAREQDGEKQGRKEGGREGKANRAARVRDSGWHGSRHLCNGPRIVTWCRADPRFHENRNRNRDSIQGYPSRCSLGLVDIKTKVVFQYLLLILKRNFSFDLWNNLMYHSKHCCC